MNDGLIGLYLVFFVISVIVAANRGGQAWIGVAVELFAPGIGLILTCVLPGAVKASGTQDRFKRIRERRREVEEKREGKRLDDERRLERQQSQQMHFALMNKLATPSAPPPNYVLPASKPEFDSPPPLPTEMQAAESWHVVVAGKKLGPLSADMIANLAKTKRIGPETMVWRKGTPEWTTLKADKDLMAMLSHLLS